MPGLLTAIAGVITAIAGLVAILVQAGFIDKTTAASNSPAERAPTQSMSSPDVRAPGTANTTHPSGLGVSTQPEVAADLRAREFKLVAATHRDGRVAMLLPDATIRGAQSIRLANGQNVSLDRLVAVDIEQPYDGNVTLLLVNGQRLPAKLSNGLTISGKNDLGRYRQSLANLRRIEFVR